MLGDGFVNRLFGSKAFGKVCCLAVARIALALLSRSEDFGIKFIAMTRNSLFDACDVADIIAYAQNHGAMSLICALVPFWLAWCVSPLLAL